MMILSFLSFFSFFSFSFLSPDDAAPKPDVVHAEVRIQRPQHTHSTAVHSSSQGAQVFTEQGGQHIQAPVL